MSERLAIEPPSPEPTPPENDGVLVGNIVGADHEGLKDAVDSNPDAGYELPYEQSDQPDVITVADIGTTDQGERGLYGRTFVKGEDGYTEAHSQKIASEPPRGSASEHRGYGATSQDIFDDVAEGYVPPFARDRNTSDPLQDYEKRVWEDVQARGMFARGEATITQEKRHIDVPGYFEVYTSGYVGLNTEQNLGILHSPEDPFQRMFDGLLERIHRLKDELKSPSPQIRAAATNDLVGMTIAMAEKASGRSFSDREKFDCYVFSPDQAREILHEINDSLRAASDESSENLSDEEQRIAKLILEYGYGAADEAGDSGRLLDGATLFGTAAEKSFIRHVTSEHADVVEAERQADLVRSTYEKLRLHALRQHRLGRQQPSYGLAA